MGSIQYIQFIDRKSEFEILLKVLKIKYSNFYRKIFSYNFMIPKQLRKYHIV